MKKMKLMQNLILCMVLIAAMALVLVGCTKEEAEAPETEVTEVEATPIGEGATTFDFTVTKADESKAAYTVKTDETTVGAALLALGLIEGDESTYGLYVKTVDGEFHEYESDGLYWAFYVNGGYAASGVDTTDIEEGTLYEFRAEK